LQDPRRLSTQPLQEVYSTEVPLPGMTRPDRCDLFRDAEQSSHFHNLSGDWNMTVQVKHHRKLVPHKVINQKLNRSDLWTIQGKFYDLTRFAGRHPGGKEFILLGKGRDCTELFMSVHQLSTLDLNAILAKYEVDSCLVDGEKLENQFSWDEQNAPLFNRLRSEVSKHFRDNHLSHKASWSFVIAASFYFLFSLSLYYQWLTRNSAVFAFGAAITMGTLGFMGMHTGSHGAMSHHGWVNYAISSFWNDFMFWPHLIWNQHHVYGHHSFTGIYGKDPDVRNMHPFARKHFSHRSNAIMMRQGWLAPIAMTMIPNQFFGQILVYANGITRKRLFGMPLIFKNATAFDLVSMWGCGIVSIIFKVLLPMYFHGVRAHLVTLVVYYFGLGLIYWSIVFPNHDTIEVVHSCDEHTKDWAELQIRNSSNFKLPWIMTHILGGMNFQIEHHLFPSVHPMHYPSISKLVQAACKDFGIPYNCRSSWFAALISHLKFLDHFSKTGSSRKTD